MYKMAETARIREYYFAEISLKIKCWGVVASTLAVGVGFEKRSPIYFLLGAASALIFWATETLWRHWQCSTMQRNSDLYALFSSIPNRDSELDCNRKSSEIIKSNRNTLDEYLRSLLCLNVVIPHMIVLLGCTSIWFLYYYGFVQFGPLKAA